MALFVGLMSGTSLDGVDAVLADFDVQLRPVASVAHVHLEMPEALRTELMALNSTGPDELHRAALAANSLSALYGSAVAMLLRQSGTPRRSVVAVGAHGQTVRHRPGDFDGQGYTLQLLNGALLAEICGIDVACDFRSADVAAGGQGAPLVPAFHHACFAQPGRTLAVLNLGGIANLTVLRADGGVGGFDCGPGNVLMDLWIRARRGEAFDADGRWAASGRVDERLLGLLLQEPYFARRPPKSTGRDLFNAPWLDARLARLGAAPRPTDVMATLAELTARAAAAAIGDHAAGADELLVCGGGARNGHVLDRLSAALPGLRVRTTDDAGAAAERVEALAFAWLAACRCAGKAASLPTVTGARGPRVLGSLYAAPR